MAQNTRQSELFAGQDWTVIYKAFSEVNLNAYDFATIRQSMKEYVERNYPEDFNDWIESSEFVAIMDLMAYLGQSLAFRMDINARENFMDIARSRESVLRLARFLSYSPKRNHPARGLVKLTEIRCTQDLIDSSGNNLNNVSVRWDDPNNPNWFEQFIMILNSSLINTNPFGTPLKAGSVNGVNTQLYRMENIPYTAGNLPFTSSVNGSTLSFDIVNMDFNSQIGFHERAPDGQASFHLAYRNDGNGNSSANTGFFLMFKQGALARSDYIVADPIENRVIDIDVVNVNESDVWVQSINDDSTISSEWTRVGYVPSDDINKIIVSNENVTYNSLPNSVQQIYQVITRDQDRISIRFGDGRFGEIPVGNLRVWYRQSAGDTYSIRPEDMRGIVVSLPYQSRDLKQRNMFFTFGLQETVLNSTPGESNDDIRRRSGNVYATQGRMVSGDDYNALPITNNLALKIKSINRVYSGHSRYIDLNDPTGTYQNTNVFSDDGALYREFHDYYEEVPLSANKSPAELVSQFIQPALVGNELRDFVYHQWLEQAGQDGFNFVMGATGFHWQQSTNAIYTSTGRFGKTATLPTTWDQWEAARAPLGVHAPDSSVERFIEPGALLKMRDAGWITVNDVDGAGDGFKVTGEGQVRVNENLTTGDRVLQVLPRFRRVFSSAEANRLAQAIDSKRSFGMGFDHVQQQWYFVDAAQLDLASAYDFASKGNVRDSSWLIKCEYSTLNWRIGARGLRHVFESDRDVKFFFVNSYRSVDPQTGRVGVDNVRVFRSNGIAHDVMWGMSKPYTYDDGYMEPRRVIVNFHDADLDGQPDNPESFRVVAQDAQWIFHERVRDIYGYNSYQLRNSLKSVTASSSMPVLKPNEVIFVYSEGAERGTFYKSILPGVGTPVLGRLREIVPLEDQTQYTAHRGRKNLSFQWKHFAPVDHRIDPAISNIIDVFVLTREYNEKIQSWVRNGAREDLLPRAPTELQLRMSYTDMEQFKMFSDQISWRPVKYKILFGQGSATELRAKFKIVKLPGTTVSDGEIKSRVIAAIQKFFDVNSWDFGETFYYTELAGYIHKQLVNAISSVVIVPLKDSQSFGELFEVRSQPDEIFFPTASVSDVEIIPANTQTSLRIR